MDIFGWIYLDIPDLNQPSTISFHNIGLMHHLFFSQARYLSTFGIFGFTSNYSWGGV